MHCNLYRHAESSRTLEAPYDHTSGAGCASREGAAGAQRTSPSTLRAGAHGRPPIGQAFRGAVDYRPR